jgi:hypothetical protein
MSDERDPGIVLPGEVLGPRHPTVVWIRNEVVPKLVETLAPSEVIVFDPPDRPSSAGNHPPGLLVVARAFEGVAMRERLARVQHLLGNVTPLRPICLTPEERRLAPMAPGPVLGALETGISVL